MSKTSVTVVVNGRSVKLSMHSQGGYRKFIWGRMWLLGKDAAKAAALAIEIEDAASRARDAGKTEWTQASINFALDLIRAVNGDHEARQQIISVDASYRIRFPDHISALETVDSKVAVASGKAKPDCPLSQAVGTWVSGVKESSRADSNKSKLTGHLEAMTLPNCKLSEFGFDALAKIVDDQIKAAKQGTLSPFTVNNRIGALRQFCKWLRQTDQYAWQGLSDMNDWFSGELKKIAGLKRARIKAKKEASRIDLDSLKVLFVATESLPLTRVCMLLALNCGMLNKELSTLMPAHLKLTGQQPYIERNRNKTQVAAKWFLWPETVKAITACGQTSDKAKPVFLTSNGLPLLHGNTDNVGLRWATLLKRVGIIGVVTKSKRRKRADKRQGEGYAFEYLRKFAAQWIRTNGGAEYYKAFLAHEESGVEANYTTFQDYEGLGKAIMDFRAYLAPMFGQKPDGEQQKNTPKKNKKPAASPAAGSTAG